VLLPACCGALCCCCCGAAVLPAGATSRAATVLRHSPLTARPAHNCRWSPTCGNPAPDVAAEAAHPTSLVGDGQFSPGPGCVAMVAVGAAGAAAASASASAAAVGTTRERGPAAPPRRRRRHRGGRCPPVQGGAAAAVSAGRKDATAAAAAAAAAAAVGSGVRAASLSRPIQGTGGPSFCPHPLSSHGPACPPPHATASSVTHLLFRGVRLALAVACCLAARGSAQRSCQQMGDVDVGAACGTTAAERCRGPCVTAIYDFNRSCYDDASYDDQPPSPCPRPCAPTAPRTSRRARQLGHEPEGP
jgi:hypothetical protein